MLHFQEFVKFIVKQKVHILFNVSINYKIVTKPLATIHID